jgi:hypothetical protein
MSVQLIKIIRIPMLLVALGACMDPADPATTEQEQDETIEVHGCRPGYIDVGEGDDMVCIDPSTWLPGAPPLPPPGEHGGPRLPPPDERGGCMGAGCGGGDQATKWTCDARCNL